MLRNTDITFLTNPAARDDAPGRASTAEFDPAAARLVRELHASLPGYQPTPLIALDALALISSTLGTWMFSPARLSGLKMSMLFNSASSLK